MKRLFTLGFLLLVGNLLHSQNYLIGNVSSITTCSGTFYDAGGSNGFAGDTYQITTFHSGSQCLSFNFEDFDLGFGGELKVYKGSSPATGILLGTYSGTNAPQGLTGETLTFEYIPPITNMGNIPGWSAEIQCVACSMNQVRSDPASDCTGAIPLCANSTVIVSTNQYTDTGSNPNDEDGSCYSGTGTGGSVWYTFSPQTNGLLDFSIVPAASADYDFVLFDATNGCNSLQEISCNYSMTTGNTGLTTTSSDYQNSYSSCSGATPFNSAPASCGVWNEAENVLTTHTYMLSVNFYSGSNDGFTLHFQNDASTVAITDNIPPTFANATQPGCDGSQVQVHFSENIDCTTMQSSDFTMSGYTITIGTTGCVSGMTTSSTLNISPTLPPGTYTLHGQTMLDMCGNALNDDITFTISNIPVTVSITGNDFCQGTQGTLTATGAGTGNLTYNWSNSATGSTIHVSSGGNYCVTVSDACAATSSACKNINMLPAPTITTSVNCNPAGTTATLSANGCSGSLTWNIWDTTCTTTCLGVILFGNCVGFSYTSCDSSWVPIGTTPSVNVNSPYASQYMANCTSANGCSTEQIVDVACVSPISVSLNSASVCSGGCTTLTPTLIGGTSPFTYTWNPSSLTGGGPQNVCPTTATTYYVTVSDATGNSATAQSTVTITSGLTPTISGALSICNGSSTTLDAGSGYINYNWSNSSTTQTITVNTSGTYSVTVSNASGCSGSASVAVTQSASLSPVITGPTSICSGSTATLDAGSGYSSYTWSNSASLQTTTISTGGVYIVTVTNASGCTGTASHSVTVGSSLGIQISPTSALICPGSSVQLSASGALSYSWSPSTALSGTTGPTVTATPNSLITYTVTGTDASGCTGTNSVTISMNSISATATSTNENCGHSNATATVTPSGTCTTGFTYLWNTIPQQTFPTATGLTAGSYTVTVSCGTCTTTATTTVSNLSGPSASVLNIISSTCDQTNGSATISAISGASPYSYAWNSVPAQYAATLSNVSAGTYSVTVSDANNCIALNTVTINNTPGPTASIANFINTTCGKSDGAANINILGGTPPYLFAWNSIPGQNTQNLSGVPTGTYTVTATDANSCSATATVTVGQNAGPSATASSTNDICGQFIGTASASPSGGSGTYTYIWNNGQITQTATGLAPGNYVVTVSDGGCSAIANVTVMNTPGPTAGFSAHPKIITTLDGPVSFQDNSSINTTSWQWNMGDGSTQSGESFDHNYEDIGTYLVTLIVTDDNGCKDTVSDTIKVKEIFTLYIPNTFTPNGDGLNDYFSPRGLSVDPDDFEMTIFDRWGNIVFKTDKWMINSAEPWNGTKNNSGTFEEVIMDVFVYRIRVKELQGTKHQYIGKIALLP
jgi:gliding motility-associated-like protein